MPLWLTLNAYHFYLDLLLFLYQSQPVTWENYDNVCDKSCATRFFELEIFLFISIKKIIKLYLKINKLKLSNKISNKSKLAFSFSQIQKIGTFLFYFLSLSLSLSKTMTKGTLLGILELGHTDTAWQSVWNLNRNSKLIIDQLVLLWIFFFF